MAHPFLAALNSDARLAEISIAAESARCFRQSQVITAVVDAPGNILDAIMAVSDPVGMVAAEG